MYYEWWNNYPIFQLETGACQGDRIAAYLFILTLEILFSGLKRNLKKCEIAGIVLLKGVQFAVCGMKYIDLCNAGIKTVGTYFSYNNTINE